MFSILTKYKILKTVITKNNPLYVQFYVSSRCHLKCKMCNIVQSNQHIQQLPLEEIEKIAKNLDKIGTAVVLLTGGEPFLREDICDIVKIFFDNNIDVRLQTAGLVQRFDSILKCAKLGANNINISMHSLNEDIADSIYGVPGAWKNAIMTIGRINREFNSNGALCALGCVLSPYNIDHIESILDFAQDIGWWLSLVPAHINNGADEHFFRGHDESFVFKDGDYPKIQKLVSKLKERKKLGDRIFDSIDYLDSILPFIRTGVPTWRKNNVCDSPGLYFSIEPDGKFAPCCDHSMPEALYVQDDKFSDVFRDPKFLQKVHEITLACKGCNFGCYPEITASVRSFGTLFERARLVSKLKKSKLKYIDDEYLFDLTKKLRSKYSY